MAEKVFQVAIDTGGTFTDVLCSGPDGALRSAKAVTTPHDLAIGVTNALRVLAEREYGLGTDEFLRRTESLVLGTTIAINTVLTLSGARAAMINTEGFVDILEQRRIIKWDLSNWKLPKPVILIPRYLRFGVEERIKYTGEVITPLNEASAREAVRKAKAQRVEVIAVCLLHSYIEPRHERRLAEIIREEYPEAEIVLSSDVLPRVGEFSRASTTAVTAYITPKVASFLRGLHGSLQANGFAGALLVMTNNAGVETPLVASQRAGTVVGSSVAGGPLSGVFLAELAGTQNVIVADIGGTSFDVSVIPRRTIATSTDNRIGDQLIAIESVSIDSIGAGGGSIARIDDRGMLTVGPDSAGAVPGPACYGKGGSEPTVTDADVVLGYVPCDYFLGGEIALDGKLARSTIEERIARPLGIGAVEAADLIKSVADSTMADQAFLSLVERGYDPGDFVLVIAGGAGPTHAFDIARHLGTREIYIPKIASVFCTLGMLNADFRHDFLQVLYQVEDKLDVGAIAAAYQRMEAEGRKTLEDEGIAADGMRMVKGADVRYYGQATEVSASLPEVRPGVSFGSGELKALIETFHERHDEVRGYSDRKAPVQIVNLKLTAVGKRKRLALPAKPGASADPAAALKSHREAYFKDLAGFVRTPCYDGDRLGSGNVIRGPAIIEEKATTVVIPPGAECSVDRYGNYVGRLANGTSVGTTAGTTAGRTK